MSDTYSFSKLDTYQQCPFKFYLKYILDKNFYADTLATSIGTLIHETEEAIAKSIVANEEINYIKLKNNIITKLTALNLQFPTLFYIPDKSGRTYHEKIYEYLETGIYALEQFMEKHPTYEIVGIEQAFNITYQGINLKGFIDRVFFDRATNNYIVQDIKTYALEVEHDKLITPLQFVIYTLAVAKLYNCTQDQIKCEYYLPFCSITQPAGTVGFINRGCTKIDKLLTAINDKKFEPNPTPLCNYCCFCLTSPEAPDEAKYLCPYYSLWERTTRNRADISKQENQWSGLENYDTVLLEHIDKHKH